MNRQPTPARPSRCLAAVVTMAIALGGIGDAALARQSDALPRLPGDADPNPGERPLPPSSSGMMGRLGAVLPIPLPAPTDDPGRPGEPPRRGRPRPGSMFDPGAAGPGISQSANEGFLDGALDPETGWPFVFLDHFRPRPDRVANLWIVDTRDCPQEMGSDPWPKLRVRHFDDQGNLVEVDPRALFAQTVGRPVLIQVQGSLTYPDTALGGLLWTHAWLERDGGIAPGTVVVAFDWPSQRIYRNDVRDINEKGRRAYVAGYHLARFVQGFPAASRVCLLGQSYGGRVVPSALHLLGGGCLNSQAHDDYVRLASLRRDLHVHGVILAGASDRQWLDPGERLDHALLGCESFLNLYNSRDEALRFYSMLIRSDHHQALGKLGLRNKDFERLGPLASRYEEHDVHELLGREHTLLDAMANRRIARLIAPHVWAPDPGFREPRQVNERSQPMRGSRRGPIRR